MYESEATAPIVQINMLRDIYNCDLITQVWSVCYKQPNEFLINIPLSNNYTRLGKSITRTCLPMAVEGRLRRKITRTYSSPLTKRVQCRCFRGRTSPYPR